MTFEITHSYSNVLLCNNFRTMRFRGGGVAYKVMPEP
jgi:hypothetical protein